jgi:hypothetical protein
MLKLNSDNTRVGGYSKRGHAFIGSYEHGYRPLGSKDTSDFLSSCHF